MQLAGHDEHYANSQTATWLSYLLELRKRMLICLLIWLVVFLGLYAFSDRLYSLLTVPLLHHLNSNNTLIATSLTATFLAPLKLSLNLSILFCIPIVLQQLWRFICPGLYQHEKLIARFLLIASILLFYSGVIFAYYLVFPVIVNFFIHIAPPGVAVIPDISSYLNFSLSLFFAFGSAFEMPVCILILVWSKLLSITQLQYYRPHIIVLNFIIAMFLTPPDIISQTMLAIPLCLLFEVGLLLARVICGSYSR